MYLLKFPDYLSACPLSISSFKKFWENVNIRWVLENIFWNTCWKFWRNVEYFENIFEIFWNYFVELFRILSRNMKTSKKCWKSKFWINSEKIMEKHSGNFKLLILRKLRRILRIFLSSFSEIVKKFWRKLGKTLYKFLDVLKGNFVIFVNFWKNLWKIIRET